jgi:hypothetical protein
MDEFYNEVNKIFHFDECLIEALHETIENNLKKGRKMVVFDDSVINIVDGKPSINEKGEIIKTKFPENQLAIINAYWEEHDRNKK